MIGIDHGYAAIKTAHFTFPSGLVAYEHEPYSMENVLEHDGLYYVIGSERQPLQKDKTKTESYYLLTLAAIAKELEYRQLPPNSEIVLAAGLPLTSFGRDKKPFRKYLLQDRKPVSFRFAGKPYSITISDVQLFPQGYAAALTQRELLEEPSVIVADLGGWTVDLMRIDNHIPNAATCRSLELGMIRCLDEISEQIRRNLGFSLTDAQIESALRGEVSSLDDQAKEIIRTVAENYVSQLLSAIQECGLDHRAMPTIFLGGGAALLKRHLPASAGLCRPFILDDVSLNAKGFERLCGQLSSREKNG
jgi:plasmid segregation protein ParM